MLMFILQIVIFLSLGVVLYLVGLAIPRVKDGEFVPLSQRAHWILDRVERVDESVDSFFEKFLRRVKVFILRLDNFVGKRLEKFKRDN